MKTKGFRILYVVLIALASTLVLFTAGCFSSIFMPLLMFAVPYYLKERNVKRYLINGVAVLLLAFVMVNLVHTNIYITAPQPHISMQQGNAALSNGTVDPFEGGAGSYSFSVIYSNLDSVQPSAVRLELNIIEISSADFQNYTMTGDTSGLASSGWEYWSNVSLPEGFYWFNFTAFRTSDGTIEVETPSAFGPRNAPWTTYASGLVPNDMLYIIFPFTLYLIIIGMYWWAGKARTMRGPARAPAEEPGGGFECTNCGAEVSESATKCIRCGAVFEEEPVIHAKKVEKGREPEAGEKSTEKKKEGRT